MYKISKRLLKKGEIINREPYFYLFGFEYTFKLSSFIEFANTYVSWVTQSVNRNVKTYVNDKENYLVVVGFNRNYKYEFCEFKREGENIICHGYFSKCMDNMYGVYDGDEMNKLVTGVEQMIIAIDPLAWVRDMWLPRTIVDTDRSFKLWQTKYPSHNMIPEEIKSKGYSNGRDFEEKYLADRLMEYGLQVYGGSWMISQTGPVPENPLVTWRHQQNVRRKEEVAKKEEEKRQKEERKKNKICAYCGNHVEPGALFCAYCGQKIEKTLEEKKDEEKVIKNYPFFTIADWVEQNDPYLYPNIDQNKNMVPEQMDGQTYEFKLKYFKLMRMLESEKGFSTYCEDFSGDNYLYVTNSRIAVINRKYNKNDGGGWIGTGGVGFLVAETINIAGSAIRAGQRTGKALIGHLRYEWIYKIIFKKKTGVLSDEIVELYYEDLNHSRWALVLCVKQSVVQADALANDILHKLCWYTSQINDEKNEKSVEFLNKYLKPNEMIPFNPSEGKGTIKIPEYYYATKSKPYCPWFY